jgi:ubiquinol-cytochrome c reductase iron-sulfur subunit
VRSTRAVTVSLVASALSSLGLAAVYLAGGQPQAEGALLAVSLGGIGFALVLIAKRFLPQGPFVEQRDVEPGAPQDRMLAEEDFVRSADEIERRGFLAKLLAAAFGALGVAALFPIRSLGTRPGRELFHTPWGPGVRLVSGENVPLKLADIPVNGFVTVFPEGETEAADAQTVLIRLAEGDVAPGPPDAAVEGVVAFSKICTHAGCPVGLYQAETRELFCPCHQSVFDVLQGAKPTEGPATRPLPQLPLAVDEDGYLVARADFPEPVGPGYWNRGR